MSAQSSMHIKVKLDGLLVSVGDMSLKRRIQKIIYSLELDGKNKIVDLGCGDGFLLHILNRLPIKAEIIGYDNDGSALKKAQKNLSSKKIKLIKGDVTDMPFEKDQFTKAVMMEILEHITNDRKALAEVYRILKPKGILILTVPNYNYPFLWDPINWLLQNIFKTHFSGTHFLAGIWARHLRLYKKMELVELVKSTGFKIEKVDELTTRCLPFNHYLINLVARFLYDYKPSKKVADPLSKFKNAKKPLIIKFIFFLVNTVDKLNDIFPGRKGLNIYIKARKQI